jgi:hypothetical protein
MILGGEQDPMLLQQDPMLFFSTKKTEKVTILRPGSDEVLVQELKLQLEDQDDLPLLNANTAAQIIKVFRKV